MPRADEPRVPVRLSASNYAVVEAAARSINVGMGALMRECAVRYAGAVARELERELAAGTTTLRRSRIESAVEAVRGQVAPASSLVVKSGAADGLARQARLNAARVSRRAK